MHQKTLKKNKETMQAMSINGAQQGDNASYEQRKNIKLQLLIKAKNQKH